MDQLAISDITWRGLPAWRIAGASRIAVISAIGGHLAALCEADGGVNPLWQPQWQASDPASVRPGPSSPYGEGSEAPTLAGIAGSNLCVPNFGHPAPGIDLPVHGDAGVSRWSRAAGAADEAVFTLRTPISGLDIARRIRLDGDSLELATTVRHVGTAELAIDWCEHTTLGGAFLDGVEISAGIDAAWTSGGALEPADRPRFAAREAAIAPAEALAVPAVDAAPCGDVLAGRVSDGWWEARNPRLGWRLAARWKREEFPWLTLWTQHRERTLPPWNSRERTRGMELNCKPFPGPRVYGSDGSWQGVPVVCRIPPGAGLTKTVRLAWSRI